MLNVKNGFIDGVVNQFHEYENEYYKTPDIIFMDNDTFQQNILIGEGKDFLNWVSYYQYRGTYEFMGWLLVPTRTNDFSCVFYEKCRLDEYITRLNLQYMRENEVAKFYSFNTTKLFLDCYNPENTYNFNAKVKEMMFYKDAVNRYIDIMGKFKGD